MLPSFQRLRTKEVAEVLKKGYGTRAGLHMSAKALLAPQDATIRSAVVVSKKVAKTAVQRNRVRRIAYDAMRHVSNELLAALLYKQASQKSFHVVFFVRSIPTTQLREAFISDISTILSSLKSRLPAQAGS